MSKIIVLSVKFSYSGKSYVLTWNSAITGLVHDNVLEAPYFLSNEQLKFFSNFTLKTRLKIGLLTMYHEEF